MRKLLLVVGLWTAALPLAPAAEPLLPRLTSDEFAAAGLAKLSPDELAQLEALFAKYGSGNTGKSAGLATAVASTKKVEPATPTSTQVAAQLAAADERVRQAQQEAAAAREAARAAKAEQKSAEAGIFAKAKKIFVSPGTQVEISAIETEIDGWFDGWETRTAWTLKDGTTWRVENNAIPYAAKRTKNPKVKIYPATLSGFWMELPEFDLKVRVRQVN